MLIDEIAHDVHFVSNQGRRRTHKHGDNGIVSFIYAYYRCCLVFKYIHYLCPWSSITLDKTVTDDVCAHVNIPRPSTISHKLPVNVNITDDWHRVSCQYSLTSEGYAEYQAGCITLSITALNSQVERRSVRNRYLEPVFIGKS